MHFLKHKFIKSLCAVVIAAATACTSSFGLYMATITGSDVNLRTSANGTVVASLAKGTKIVVISNDSDWYRVAVNGVTGYVSKKYICAVGNGTGSIALGRGVITGATSLLETADASSKVLSALPSKATVTVVGVYQNYYQVKYGEVTGYVAASYVYISGRTTTISRGEDSRATELRQKVLSFAATLIGTPYSYGHNSPSEGFDCSGFTSYVYGNTVRSIPRTSNSQYSGLTHVASMSELQPADLVFFGTSGTISHVGIYAGEGKFIHAPHTGTSVRYDTLWSGNYKARYIGAARIIFDS